MAESNLTAARVREVLIYDPETGIFVWRIRRSNKLAGSIAGSPRDDGYFDIRIDGRIYRAHRLAWLYMTGSWPEHLIDHEDRNPSNTRWKNLRPATHSQNHQNTKPRSDGRMRGVELHEGGLWRARIVVAKKRIQLGYYKTLDEANAARREGERTYFTHSPACKLPV